MESAFILGGSAGASSADGLDWANLSAGNALDAWDFLTDQARFNSVAVGPLANTPGWSYTRSDAQTAYAQTSAGVLTPFATGVLRRTDKGVLIEGARTNLCLQSQTFDNASWTKSQSTVTADAIAAPDGTTTADKIVEDSATNVHNVNQAPTTTVASYTFSVFLKAAERTFAMLYHATSNVGTVFNLGTGATAGNADVGAPASATITAYANGWYLCSITVTATAAANSFRIYLCSNSTTYNYAGNGSNGLYAWGAQVELGAFPSSYIPTTTASATRAADVLSVPVSGIDYPISLFAEFERVVDTGGAEGLIQIDAGASTNRVLVSVSTSDTAQIFVASVAGGGTQASEVVAGALTLGTVYKTAGRCATNSVRNARGGTLGTEDVGVVVPATPTTIRFSQETSGSQSFGYLRKAALWTRALSDSELQTVST